MRSAAHGRQRVVTLSDGRELLFSDEACTRLLVAVGMQATPELLKELELAERRVNAHDAALRLLAARARSEDEMRTRLAMRGFDPEAIESEIERLRGAGLLDDQKFAEAWVADRRHLSPRGKRMVRYELLGRGITPDAAEEATRDLDDRETALDLARTRAQRSAFPNYEAFYSKVGGFLRRRGFDYEAISHAVRSAWEERQLQEREANEGRPEQK